MIKILLIFLLIIINSYAEPDIEFKNLDFYLNLKVGEKINEEKLKTRNLNTNNNKKIKSFNINNDSNNNFIIKLKKFLGLYEYPKTYLK